MNSEKKTQVINGKEITFYLICNFLPKVRVTFVPCFLVTGTGLDTHSVIGTRYMKPYFKSFTILAFIEASFHGCTRRSRCQTIQAPGWVLIS